MKIEIVAVVVALTLVVGVLTFSLNSYFQSVDAKDNYDKLRESLRKKAESAAGVSDSDRENTDILSSNRTNFGTNTSASSTVTEGADGANAINAGGDGADGADGVAADGADANGTSVIGADGADANG